ncbi:MAG TPA: PilZ domain-containing protein [Pyrinomonadaceae bacterium]
MFSAWDTINRNRRVSPRYRARLPVSVSLVEPDTEESRWPSVLAYTRDVSREGMSIILLSPRLGCHELNKGDYNFQIILAVSSEASVRVTARLVHCGVFNEDEAGAGYLVGVKIEEIGPEDRLLYDEFIGGLR